MISLSPRLIAAASFVESGARVCDIGCDHGYLAIYLTTEGIAQSVTATDIKSEPLRRGYENAERCGALKDIKFIQSDGLDEINLIDYDTIIICGMGGDTITGIISRESGLQGSKYRLILQPMSSADSLRRYLYESGFEIKQEKLVMDSGRMYCVLVASYSGNQIKPEPWQCYLSPALAISSDPLMGKYLEHLINALKDAVNGTARSSKPHDVQRHEFFREAIKGLEAIKDGKS